MGDKYVIMGAAGFGRCRRIAILAAVAFATGFGMFAAPADLRGWRAPSLTGSGAGRGGREQRYFVDCVLHRRPIEGAASPQVARHAQEVIEAVYRSASLGRAVRLPLE